MTTFRPRIGPPCAALLALMLAGLAACEQADNQVMMDVARRALVNPPLSDLPQRLEAARAHKVLVAVIDSGVDYNHPLLKRNIHVQFDAQGQLIGTGWDFLGEDAYPHPLLALNPLQAANPSEEIRDEFDSDCTGPSALTPRCFGLGSFLAQAQPTLLADADRAEKYARLAADFPEIAPYLQPGRALRDEALVAQHGTHVAGLAALNNPAIGILPYRVLPLPRYDNAGQKVADTDQLSIFVDKMLAAIERAARDGARIVNLSVGLKHLPSDLKEAAFGKRMKAALEAHPGVVFVAAAGNDGDVIDNVEFAQFPCGLDVANLVCVGALNENFYPTDFTNFPKKVPHLVFAPGADVRSTLPTGICAGKDIDDAATNWDGARRGDESARSRVAQQVAALAAGCDESGSALYRHQRLGVMSGTSMASPLVANLLARIAMAHPELDAAGLIRHLEDLTLTLPSESLPVPVRVSPVGKPVWSCLMSHPGQEHFCSRFMNGAADYGRLFKYFD